MAKGALPGYSVGMLPLPTPPDVDLTFEGRELRTLHLTGFAEMRPTHPGKYRVTQASLQQFAESKYPGWIEFLQGIRYNKGCGPVCEAKSWKFGAARSLREQFMFVKPETKAEIRPVLRWYFALLSHMILEAELMEIEDLL